MDNETCYSINAVAQRTGLSAHQIRVWERRYQAVVPTRTKGGHRLYSEADVQRLLLLHQALAAGHQIGKVANLDAGALWALASTAPVPVPTTLGGALDHCLAAVQRLDAQALDHELSRAHAEYGHHALVDQLLEPLLTRIGELWHEGQLRIANEHLASAVVRSFVGRLQASRLHAAGAPLLIATTPAGQRHELGALLAAHAGLAAGWQTLFLGAELPAEEIAGACQRTEAHALALSLVYPADDLHLAGELVRVRQLLGPQIAILVGGRAAPVYRSVLGRIGARCLPNLAAFRSELAQLGRHLKRP